MRVINVLDRQACDSRIMRVSWLVYACLLHNTGPNGVSALDVIAAILASLYKRILINFFC